MDEIQKAVQKYFDDCKQGITNIISSQQLYKEIQENKDKLFLLDIRKEEDFAKSRIEGSINMFWHEVDDIIDVLPKDEKIIVICYTGQSSSQVVSLLKVLGYNAYSLSGGIENGWLKSSMPTDSGCSL